jgi:sulfite exporter TauE/SafE
MPAMTLRRGALWGLLIAKAVAGIGVGWDIRWHIVIGRDSFWIAPHVMTYSGVAAVTLLSLGVLARETWAARRGRTPRDGVRIAGLVGSRGYHLAWWGIALTILAAPIDDLWHRLFGIDVTLWSPPHLLGLAGAQINSIACLLIAREAWPAGARARTVALTLGGLLLFSGFQTGVDPSLRTAFIHGGVRFFTYAALGALFFTFSLVLAARLAASRTMPVVIAVTAVVLQLAVIVVGDVGMAVLRPEPALGDALTDPTSPIGVAHEIARRNGVMPGRGFTVRLFPVLPAVLMALIDARRRPLAAGLAFGLGLYAVNGVMFMRSPAFTHAHPDSLDAIAALVVTALAAVVSTVAATAFEARLAGAASGMPVVTGAVPVA